MFVLISGCTVFASDAPLDHMSKSKPIPPTGGVVSAQPKAADRGFVDYRNAKPIPMPSLGDGSDNSRSSNDKHDAVGSYSSPGGVGSGKETPEILFKDSSKFDINK